MRFGNAFFYSVGHLLSMIRHCKAPSDLVRHIGFIVEFEVGLNVHRSQSRRQHSI
jgi:hypothetical protein